MDKRDSDLKESIKEYQEKFKEKFASYVRMLKEALSSYEESYEGKVSTGISEKIEKIRKGVDKFEEMNDEVQRLRDRL